MHAQRWRSGRFALHSTRRAGFASIGGPLGRTPGSAASLAGEPGGSRTTVVREFLPP